MKSFEHSRTRPEGTRRCGAVLATLLLGLAVLSPMHSPGQKIPEILDDSFGYLLPSPAGVEVWWCEATYKVGRERALPNASGSRVQISAARNEYEPFQIVLNPGVGLSNTTVSVSDFVRIGSPSEIIRSTNVEICVVEYVPVIEPTDVLGCPGDWPDPILPLTVPVALQASLNQPFWFTVHVPRHALAGDYEATATFSAAGMTPFDVGILLHVFNFSLSDVTHTETAYYGHIHDFKWNYGYVEPSLAEKRLMYDIYLQDYRKHRVSPYSVHLYSPIKWQLVDGDFVVDFSSFDEAMSRYLDELDFTSFNLFGRKSPDFPYTLGGYSAFTPEYQVLFNKLMDKIMAHLREKGWGDKAYCLWYDEPPTSVYDYYFSGMDALQQAAPDLRRLATLNVAPWNLDQRFYGRVDVWSPVESGATDPVYLNRKKIGEENWWYAATGPRYPFPNIFIDHPAINQRIRFWAAEKYGLTGDLYWAVNYWALRDPWKEARTFLPYEANGDGALVYPPTKTPPTGPVFAPPTDSVRWELTRESLEDSEYFWLVKELMSKARRRIGPDHLMVLEGESALAEVAGLVTNIQNYFRPDYSQDPQELYAARERLGSAIEALDDGMPFFVKSPISKAVDSGGTVKLYCEALGWPLPRYQWRKDGAELPGETNSVLVLANCGPLQTGTYTATASNRVGVATSEAAEIAGYWSELPSILVQPTQKVQYEGEKAILVVTAVSTNEMGYQWLRNGEPVAESISTNPVLLLTNLTASMLGDYSVIISNSAGMVTSATTRLTVLWDSLARASVASAGDAWRYHDQNTDPGAGWKSTGYDDSGWLEGGAPLGFGNGDETTLINSNAAAVYFRKTFVLAEAPDASPMTGSFRADDGIVAYLNGTELFRHNMPEGEIGMATSADSPVEGAAEDSWIPFSVPVANWQPGTNVLAVELHQFDVSATLPPGPVAFWTLDEAVAPWNDQSGGHGFSPVGSGMGSMAGRVEGCVTNRSNTGWLETPDASDLRYTGPFTVGGWFAFLGTAPETVSPVTCLEKDGEFRLYYTGTATNRYRFTVGNAEVLEPTPGAGYNQWRFVVAWHDGTNSHIQMNNGTVYSSAATPPAATSNSLVALKLEGAQGQFAADEMFMFKRVLSAAERTSIYSDGLRAFLNPLPYDLDLAMDFSAGVEFIQKPQVLESPADLVRWEGQNAAFEASVASATPLSYQWLFNNTAIPGATKPLLFRAEVTAAEAGLYRLEVSNSGGAVHSDPANLDVLALPVLSSHWPGTNAGYGLLVPPNPGHWNVLASSNLLDWSLLDTVPPGTEPALVIDDNATNAPVRFYKLELQ